MFNPLAAFPAAPQNGQYDGTTFANSGIMGKEQGQVPSFSLTFTKAGTYNYLCAVHTPMKMVGTIVVDEASASIPTPQQVSAQAQQEASTALANAASVVSAAETQVKPDVKNADGTTTHYVTVGYEEGQVDLMAFFPKEVTVKPGDTVVWDFSPKDMAPHTITFLNGAEEPPLVKAIPQQSGLPILTIDPGVYAAAECQPAGDQPGDLQLGCDRPGSPRSAYLLDQGWQYHGRP